MKAFVGDRYVQASGVVDGPVRDGTVVELRHPDGTPPYVVEWSDTGERTLVYPGTDAHVEHGETQATAATGPPAVVWRVQLTVTREGNETTAHAVLAPGEPDHLAALGRARRNPEDGDVAVIGDEVAVARALHHLADRLIDAAEEQIEDATGRPARVHG
ncbi:dsRBD fold-containing protein [Actinotalea sp.]|uniref:dsRBD fold-containing protein n=1 Tax=Actinotalea sp. TaxID=1872145 RepID=UPI0035632023